MAHQMVRQERPFAVYRLVGEGPIGFSVMCIPPSGAPPKLSEKLSRWKDQPRLTDAAKLEVATVFGEFARSQDWAKISEVAIAAGLFRSEELIERFGQRGELTAGLYAVQLDSGPESVGGCEFVADFWHWGHTRDNLKAREAFVPYDWALRVLAELERRKAAEILAG